MRVAITGAAIALEGVAFQARARDSELVAGPRILMVEGDRRVVRNWSEILAGRATIVAARSFSEAWELTTETNWRTTSFPFVFVNLRLADGDGLDLLPRLRALIPRPQVAVLAGRLDATLAVRLHGLCAIALPRPADRSVLLDALAILEAAGQSDSSLERFARVYRLSKQEAKLLSLAVQEVPNKRAAAELGCSECTARTYWQRVFAKVGCGSQRDVLARLLRFSTGQQPPAAVA